MKYIAGIDIGTSGVKCIIIDEKGQVKSSDTQPYPLIIKQAGWSEQEPSKWWDATLVGMNNAVKESGVAKEDIVAVGFCGQMHGLVALDSKDNVIRNAILWNDLRTQDECDEIIELAGGLDGLLRLSNNNMLPGFTGGKLLWVKNHEIDNYNRIDKFMMPKDYIRFLFTGEKYTEVSDASGTGLFDVENRMWNFELVKQVGLDPSMFVECLESDDIAGHLKNDVANACGLMENIPVFAGGGDAVIQSTGMGIVEEGNVGLIIGTSGIVSMSLDGFGVNTGGKLQFFCNNAKNKWSAFGCQLSSGGSLEWFKNNMYDCADPFKEINIGVEASPAGSKNLLFLPYLTGERCPHSDTNARGVFFGLSLSHNRGDMARSIMEGVTFGLKEIYDLIKEAKSDIKPKAIISSGGASKSKAWRQIQADIFNLPVKTLTGASEGGAYGGAIVAAVGMGFFKDIREAASMLKEETITWPVKENVAVYEELFKTYQGLYEDLKDRFIEQ